MKILVAVKQVAALDEDFEIRDDGRGIELEKADLQSIRERELLDRGKMRDGGLVGCGANGRDPKQSDHQNRTNEALHLRGQ